MNCAVPFIYSICVWNRRMVRSLGIPLFADVTVSYTVLYKYYKLLSPPKVSSWYLKVDTNSTD
jgi:hypothetical protein